MRCCLNCLNNVLSTLGQPVECPPIQHRQLTFFIDVVTTLARFVETEAERTVTLDKEDARIQRIMTSNNFCTPSECARPCTSSPPKKCYYRFYLEQYTVFGKACEMCTPNRTNGCQCILADGIERMAFTVNRMIPGPTIDVCQGDMVIIDVMNHLLADSVTIHWHGVLQRNSQFYDGVPYVTQCPILPGNTFRYQWIANEAGTHFWHSHTGLQKTDGLTGPIIVRQSNVNNPRYTMYDFDLTEHAIFIQDWNHEYMNEKFPGRRFTRATNLPTNLLINGKGKFFDVTTGQYSEVGSEIFNVRTNMRYRFRMINALASICPVQLTIDNHTLTVIAIDGNPVKPVDVNSIISVSAERYDFIVKTNSIGGTYWIQVRTLQDCRFENLNQVAALRYNVGSQTPRNPRPTNNLPLPTGKVLNPLDANCNVARADAICVSQLAADESIDPEILSNRIVKVYLPFRLHIYDPNQLFRPGTYKRYQSTYINRGTFYASGLIDNITYTSAPSPLLTQYQNLNTGQFCNGDQIIQNCDLTCECTHVIKVPYNCIIELILVDEVHNEGINHPFHLHGFAFNVMGIGKMPPTGTGTVEEAIMLDRNNLLNRRFDSPPFKDTIMIPSNGYVVLRFRANNPGFWFLHCHFLFHLITGMAAVLQVGEYQNMPIPPSNFPRCGNYVPYA
ncbi:hypothetical protein FQR65_LT08943 [Abscondita terminalis]|nr:hypothetical protein FQR65_LT08943 [Abscondita terminalis]